eukprot:CAMPEP_0170631038 /NCGR_PEP_ID=MMETSP0224-20130122/34377_1 /TAXON_ID=285029 /ORGANISM="Togula jolla, Strain CCCM 725" /LENGTH=242 /DNA_ID=CAMNT_0010959249 /DNA_START=65 /DNA_END=793 /DNA_ORIENTATION=-
MVRSRLLAVALAVLAIILAREVVFHVSQLFVAAPFSPSVRLSGYTALRAEAAEDVETETETDGAAEPEPEPKPKRPRMARVTDKLDNLDQYYQETITGKGGTPKGFFGDLILRNYFGTWSESGTFTPSREFTGPRKQPSRADYDTAFENFKMQVKEGKTIQGKDDGSGWIWFVVGQNPGGLYLYLSSEVPWGERPVALIRKDNPEEFFTKADWKVLTLRLNQPNLWGGKVKKFPYPLKGAED